MEDLIFIQRTADLPFAEIPSFLDGINLNHRYNAGATSPLQM